MLKPNSLFILALLSLFGGAITQLTGWWKQHSLTAKFGAYLYQLSAGLLLIGLIWLAVERGHFPASTLDELWLVLALLIALLYFVIHPKIAPASSAAAGMLLNAIVLGWGIYLLRSNTPHIGLAPLWVWALIGRWTLLLGIAALYWLAVIALFTLVAQILKRANRLQQLNNALIALAPAQGRLRILGTSFWLGGSFVLITRSWWSGDNIIVLSLTLIIPILLLSAGWWLRFAHTRRMWLEALLTIFTFVAALPAMNVIV